MLVWGAAINTLLVALGGRLPSTVQPVALRKPLDMALNRVLTTGVVKMVWDSNTTRFKNFDASAIAPSGYGAAPKAAMPEPKPRPAPSGGSGGAPWTQQGAGGGDAPFTPNQGPGGAFGGRSKTGPIDNHRDGGGPEADLGDIPT